MPNVFSSYFSSASYPQLASPASIEKLTSEILARRLTEAIHAIDNAINGNNAQKFWNGLVELYQWESDASQWWKLAVQCDFPTKEIFTEIARILTTTKNQESFNDASIGTILAVDACRMIIDHNSQIFTKDLDSSIKENYINPEGNVLVFLNETGRHVAQRLAKIFGEVPAGIKGIGQVGEHRDPLHQMIYNPSISHAIHHRMSPGCDLTQALPPSRHLHSVETTSSPTTRRAS